MTELLIGTRKGLVVLRGKRGGPFEMAARAFPGEVVEFAVRDSRSGRYFAGVTNGQFGPHLFFADDPAGKWEQAEGPAFPPGADAAVERIWVVQPGESEGSGGQEVHARNPKPARRRGGHLGGLGAKATRIHSGCA